METPRIKATEDEEREHAYIVEWDGSVPLPEGATDAHLLKDADAMPFSWDVEHERPPRW